MTEIPAEALPAGLSHRRKNLREQTGQTLPGPKATQRPTLSPFYSPSLQAHLHSLSITSVGGAEDFGLGVAFGRGHTQKHKCIHFRVGLVLGNTDIRGALGCWADE